METNHLLLVKGTKPIPQTEAACHSPLVSLWFFSHEHIFPSSPLGGPLIASLDSLPSLAERPSLLFPAHSSLTPMSVLVSRPHPPLTTCPKLLAILVEIMNIKNKKRNRRPAVTISCSPEKCLPRSSRWHRLCSLWGSLGKLLMSMLVGIKRVCVIVLRTETRIRACQQHRA